MWQIWPFVLFFVKDLRKIFSVFFPCHSTTCRYQWSLEYFFACLCLGGHYQRYKNYRLFKIMDLWWKCFQYFNLLRVIVFLVTESFPIKCVDLTILRKEWILTWTACFFIQLDKSCYGLWVVLAAWTPICFFNAGCHGCRFTLITMS